MGQGRSRFAAVTSGGQLISKRVQSSPATLNVPESVDVDAVSSFVLAASAVVHSVQAERGSSCVYCSSQGLQFARTLELFRAVTDESWELLTQTSLFHKGHVPVSHDELDVMRLRVDAFMPYIECFQMYSIIAERLLRMIAAVLEPLQQTYCGNTVSAFLLFLCFKEYNGRERAMISASISGGGQSSNAYALMVKIKGAQQALANSFLLIAPREIASTFQAACMPPHEVAMLSERISTSREAAEESMKELTAEQWFRVMTERMNKLEGVQNAIIESLHKQVGASHSLTKVLASHVMMDWEKTLHEANRTFSARARSSSASSTPPLPVEPIGSSHVDITSAMDNGQVHRVVLREQIGEGMAGPIFKGEMDGALVAVKLCKTVDVTGQDVEDKADILREFVREVSVISVMRHPNIVQFVGSSLSPPRYAMVLEYMDGGTLWSVLRKAPSTVGFFNLSIQVARGLQYIHDVAGLMHRDLKSPNLLLSSMGELKIADFGLCCLGDVGQQNQIMEIGTLRWMAPEILLHQAYSKSADIYSLGVILWELLTKQVPFVELQHGADLHKPMMIHVAEEKLRPRFPAKTPTAIRELIQSCWHPVPSMRPPASLVVHRIEVLQSSMKDSERAFLQQQHSVKGMEPFSTAMTA
uniref:Tkl protein kinase n=1 Tax=Tetraselmis sp. GSL018 TaxID=582737 RepID=A0A061R5V2_9CHLO